MKKSFLGTTFLALLAAASLAGCSSSSNETTAETAAEAAEETTAEAVEPAISEIVPEAALAEVPLPPQNAPAPLLNGGGPVIGAL